MRKLLYITLVVALSTFVTACSGAGEKGAGSNTTATAPPATTGTSGGGTSDAPPAVRAALPDAQSITAQHKDLSASQVSEIEKETGTKIKETDHHSYLGFSTAGGARKQIGAATLVNAGGKEMVILYESREGSPYIKEVRAAGVAQAFLDQFKGKGHDDKLQIGQDIKAQGVDEATAKAAADAIRQDTRIMQTLYGGAHTH